jgi:transcriptional regulator GlxA family with amidase domain
VPASAIAPLVPDIGNVVAQRIPAESEALALLRRYLGIIRDAPAMATPELQHRVATHVYDLLAAALGATRDAMEIAKGRGVRVARLHAIKADIVENLNRVDLSVDEVAARHRVTPRYVQMLFETEGSTFTESVLGWRLARAHRMLTDSRFAGRSITSVAFEVGFGDLSYFNRTFRRRFGDTPSGTRTQARRDDR